MADLVAQRSDFTRSLPVGWKQRLALGCAVLHDPPILFLDEPTSGVDPISRRRFWELIYELSSRGVTVFVTTHYMEEAEYCERLGMIYRGELIADGTPEELKTTLMRGHVLEITADPPQEAMAAIASVEGVSETALFGTAIHALVMEDAASIEPAIERRLADGGFTGATVRRIKPSLEDVFVALVRERDARTAPVAEVRG
jgi:ABC-2 type transport system ATP-binding protein